MENKISPKGEWIQLDEKKWEFRTDQAVIATIYHKPGNDKFSLWFCSPMIFAGDLSFPFRTHQYETIEDQVFAIFAISSSNCAEI